MKKAIRRTDENGKTIGFARKRTKDEILADCAEYFEKLPPEVKTAEYFEQFKEYYIKVEMDTNCDTSGVWVTENENGSIEIGYEDYDVPYYSGMDHEFTSRIDKESAEKFKDLLKKMYPDSINLEDAVLKEFTFNYGEAFHHEKYEDFCKENGIKHNDYCWTA